MEKTYSAEIALAVHQFLVEDDWRFSFDKETGEFSFGLLVKSKLKEIQYSIDIKEDEAVFYAFAPICADSSDEGMISTMARFLCRANYGLKNGCFELDVHSGDICYRSYIDCSGGLPSREVIRNSIYVIPRMFDRYAPGILAVLFQGATDKEAMALCGKAMEAELRPIAGALEEKGSEELAALPDKFGARFGITGKEGSRSGGEEETLRFRTDLFSEEGSDK